MLAATRFYPSIIIYHIAIIISQLRGSIPPPGTQAAAVSNSQRATNTGSKSHTWGKNKYLGKCHNFHFLICNRVFWSNTHIRQAGVHFTCKWNAGPDLNTCADVICTCQYVHVHLGRSFTLHLWSASHHFPPNATKISLFLLDILSTNPYIVQWIQHNSPTVTVLSFLSPFMLSGVFCLCTLR